jgi:hypothetical protein
MKTTLSLPALTLLAMSTAGCGADEPQPDGPHDTDGDTDADQTLTECAGQLALQAPLDGDVFVDGLFTGSTVPTVLTLEPGEHRIGVGTTDDRYLLHSITVSEGDDQCELSLDEDHLLPPKIWKALYVDIPTIQGQENGCLVEPSEAELDAMYRFFEGSIVQLEAHSYNAMAWEITRVRTTEPAVIDGGSGNFVLEPSDLGDAFSSSSPGDYDTIFTAWKAQGDDGCVLDAWYFGLGWTPQEATKQMGFVNLRFQTNDVVAQVEYYSSVDPGGNEHEFLHTVEGYYPGLGSTLPEPAGGFPLHAAEVYGYTHPWLDWYADFIRGKVADLDGDGWLGIGVEQLNRCSTADAVLNPGEC